MPEPPDSSAETSGSPAATEKRRLFRRRPAAPPAEAAPAADAPDGAGSPPDPNAPAEGGAPSPAPRRRLLRRRPPRERAGGSAPEPGEGGSEGGSEGGPDPAADAAPRRRLGLRRRARPADGDGSADAPADAESSPPPARREGPGRLRRRRKRLLTRREEAVYHLGGLAFELYRRDMLQEEVMRRRAGEVAELDDTVRDIDARMEEIGRERRRRRAGPDPHEPVGHCLACRAPFRAEARFCWQCGARLVPRDDGDEQPTGVIARGDAGGLA